MESVHLEGFLFCFRLCGNSNFLVSNSSRLYLYRSGLEGAQLVIRSGCVRSASGSETAFKAICMQS